MMKSGPLAAIATDIESCQREIRSVAKDLKQFETTQKTATKQAAALSDLARPFSSSNSAEAHQLLTMVQMLQGELQAIQAIDEQIRHETDEAQSSINKMRTLLQQYS
eukprot:c5711_g1_i1.p1 GENE.c5711_g1_i1~~c5711_g1_i1.p1  ORF type:complete len:107 (-),score=24.92 c5711_g1_i1:87-407(-)